MNPKNLKNSEKFHENPIKKVVPDLKVPPPPFPFYFGIFEVLVSEFVWFALTRELSLLFIAS